VSFFQIFLETIAQFTLILFYAYVFGASGQLVIVRCHPDVVRQQLFHMT